MAPSNPVKKSTLWKNFSKIFYRFSHLRPSPDPRARSWAREIKKFTDLPGIYKTFFQVNNFDTPERFPYTVISPTFKGGPGRPENERLLFICDRSVGVLEWIDDSLTRMVYTPEKIILIERGSILLHAWLTFTGETAVGIKSTTIPYNAVTHPIMAPFLACLRPTSDSSSGIDLDVERSQFDYLIHSNYKFMSYGRACIQPGARVIEIIFQPQIRDETLKLSGFCISRLVQPAQLMILTNAELIILRDDASQRWSKRDPHGAIWTFIPRPCIAASHFGSVEGGRLQLTVDILSGSCLRWLFDSVKFAELNQLTNEMKTRPLSAELSACSARWSAFD